MDIFCGAGGSSIGIHEAGVEVKLAVNHDELALRTHAANFTRTRHVKTDISTCDPRKFPTTLGAWFSSSCTDHSVAKGNKRKGLGAKNLWGEIENEIDDVEERSRATMWDVVRFSEHHDYKLVIVENVVDIRHWRLYEPWLHAMTNLDYEHRAVYLNSMVAHPTPQSRDRIYICFWKKGNRRPDLEIRPRAHCRKCSQDVEAVQTWKNRAKPYGKYGERNQYLYCCPKCASVVTPYYYAAANAIDWSLPMHTVGDRRDPAYRKRHNLRQIGDNTRRRIKIGLQKFSGRQFGIDYVHTARGDNEAGMTWPMTGPMRTLLANRTLGVAVPFMVQPTHAGGDDRTREVSQPLPTITTSRDMSVVLPFLAELYGLSDASPITDPLGTQTTVRHNAVIAPDGFLTQTSHEPSESRVRSLVEPMHTVTTMNGEQSLVLPSFISSYYTSSDSNHAVTEPLMTITANDRHALITPKAAAFLFGYYNRGENAAAVSSVLAPMPTQCTRPRGHYLVRPARETVDVTDEDIDACGYRGLVSAEVGRGMAFPDTYIVLGNEDDRVRQYGNAVTPPVAELLTERMIQSL